MVVLSYGNEDSIPAAVESVLAQHEPVELVVSHSRPGRVQDLLPEVRVVASRRRRLPGAGRNAGVVATSAPDVAFLSGDARARPGWVTGPGLTKRALTHRVELELAVVLRGTFA